MFVKDRDRQAGGESWIPSIFAFFWIVLAGFGGAYIFKMVADEDLLNREVAELTTLGSGAAAAQGLSLEERQAIIDSRRMQDRTISELKDTVETLKQQVETLTARLEGTPLPPADPAPTAATPELPPADPAAPEPPVVAVPPLPGHETSGAVVTSPPAADTDTPTITASPAIPQADDPEADDEGEEEDRSAAPQILAETAEAEAETEQVTAPATAGETVVVEEESQAVTYGIPSTGPRVESSQDETVRSLQMAAATDPGMKFGIEIGSVEEQKSLRPMWRDLLTKHAALVAGLEARRVMAPDKKWRLIAGPFANPVEATQACTLFKKAELPCEATVFAGDSL